MRASVHRSGWSNLERGELDRVSLRTLRDCLAVLEVTIDIVPRWRGTGLGRLLDEEHAELQAAWAARLRRWGYVVWPEVSFNHFGDRGRCDVVGWSPIHRMLLLVEVKTRIGDLQDTLGRLDVKARVGGTIAEQLGFGPPGSAVPALVLAEDGANRRIVARYDTLLRQLGARGRAALAWIGKPSGTVTGMLWFESPDSARSRTKRPGTPAGRLRAG